MKRNLWIFSPLAKPSFYLEFEGKQWYFRWGNFDWILLIAAIFLMVLGSMTILSTVLSPDVKIAESQLFISHLFNIAISLGFFLIFLRLDYRIFKHFSVLMYLSAILLLIFVLVLGHTTRGSMRWIDLGFFRFQPSEMAKILLTCSLASYFSSLKEKINDFRYILLSLVLTLIPTILVIAEPDLGTGMVLIAIWIGMLILSGARLRHLALFFLGGLLTLPLVWFFILVPYQKDRILAFLNPKTDPLGSGYAVIQSIIAVGSGKLLGRGWGRGTQSHLQFLPERSTDFIFASLAEELGFLGISILLLSYGFFLIRILKIVKNAADSFGSFIGIGFFMMFIFQIVVNIGMNLGIMPITGIPLPLVSYGGTSLATCFIALGILESIALHQSTSSGMKIDSEEI